jgi:hypothetical protein
MFELRQRLAEIAKIMPNIDLTQMIMEKGWTIIGCSLI